MRKFKVNSDRIVGINGKLYVRGQEIEESQINPSALHRFIASKRLIEVKDYSIPSNRKIKLAIVTSVWGRQDVIQMFIQGINNLIDNCKEFEIYLIVSGSHQDENHDYSLGAFEYSIFEHLNLDYKYIEIPNEPLAAKVNATTYAAGKLGVDYVLCMGSDDIISPELLNEYGKLMRKGIDFIGVTDFYFYDTVSKRSLYWGGYTEPNRKGHTAGAARCLSARLLDQWNWMPWENKDSLMLDKSMQDKLKVTPHTIETFSMKSKGLFAVDIKSSTNMTPFEKWNNSDFIDNAILQKQFPYIF